MYLPRKARSVTCLPLLSSSTNGPPTSEAVPPPPSQIKAPVPSNRSAISRPITPKIQAGGLAPPGRPVAGSDVELIAGRTLNQSSSVRKPQRATDVTRCRYCRRGLSPDKRGHDDENLHHFLARSAATAGQACERA